jgi:hypothetical protein
VQLENVGYAAPFNPRSLQVLLGGGGSVQRASVSAVDPRWWLPGGPIALRIEVQLPTSLTAGDYELGLALPDAAASLADRPEYAIRFANEGVWVAADGYNRLGTLSVDDGATGDAAPDRTQLAATLAD